MNYRHLLPKFAAGTATADERRAFHQWLETLSIQEFQEVVTDYEKLLSAQSSFDPYNVALLDQLLSSIQQEKEKPMAVHRVQFLRTAWFRYAAAILVIVAGLVIYYSIPPNSSKSIKSPQIQVQTPDIQPGRNGALLTLADGRTIVLDSLGNGAIASQGGTDVVLQNGQLAYNETTQAAHDTTKGKVLYNTMQTPRGRQFQLTLPDGTRILLNAVSSVRYPTAFTGHTREVEISGEAYLEVAKDPSKKFIVHTTYSTVEVLGTHFNVNAYEEEATTNITLLEGKVLVHAGRAANGIAHSEMSPGYQAQVPNTANPTVILAPVDVDQFVAWKNGVFNFQGYSVPAVMRQIERWYDVEVVYEKNVPNIVFGGKVQRSLSLSQLIKGLEDEQIHFRIEGRKLIVTP